MRFRKKPIVIEAQEVSRLLADAAHNWPGLPTWIRVAYEAGDVLFGDGWIDIRTLEGTMRANPGDFVICGVKGELYPCKPDIFWLTYEADTGHSCMWCPVEVRDLSACAHNAAVAHGTARAGKKMRDLKNAIDRYRPAVDAHFAAIKDKP